MQAASTLSVAGLTPITASPAPSSRPSSVEAATPRGSSVGWLGCSRTESRPGSPIVLRKRVTTRHFAATATRSCRRISLLTAAAISGVRPGRSAVSASGSAASRNSRNSPTVSDATGAKAAAIMAVDDQPRDLVRFVGDDRLGKDRRQRQIGQRHLRRHPFGGGCWRPARPAHRPSGTASPAPAACAGRRKTWRVPASVWA